MTYTSKVLLIYTGGTIGMNRNPRTGALEPFDFEHLLKNVPELQQVSTDIDTYQFNSYSLKIASSPGFTISSNDT